MTNRVTAQAKCKKRPALGFKPNHKKRNKVSKRIKNKPVSYHVELTQSQYENILEGLRSKQLPRASVCKQYKLNIHKSFFPRLLANEIDEYKKWFK